MTDEQKITYVKTATDEQDEDIISTYLSVAEQKIIDIAFPYDEVSEMPTKYAMKQCEIAIYLLNKRGAEGEVKHTENGVTREYADADIPASMLRGIVPKVGIIK